MKMQFRTKEEKKGFVREARAVCKAVKEWFKTFNNHTEITITSGYYKGQKAIIIAEYKHVSLIEFYNSNQSRIYLDNVYFTKTGRSKTR